MLFMRTIVDRFISHSLFGNQKNCALYTLPFVHDTPSHNICTRSMAHPIKQIIQHISQQNPTKNKSESSYEYTNICNMQKKINNSNINNSRNNNAAACKTITFSQLLSHMCRVTTRLEQQQYEIKFKRDKSAHIWAKLAIAYFRRHRFATFPSFSLSLFLLLSLFLSFSPFSSSSLPRSIRLSLPVYLYVYLRQSILQQKLTIER